MILESLKSLAHVLFKRTGSLVLCAVFRVLQVGLIKRQKKKILCGACPFVGYCGLFSINYFRSTSADVSVPRLAGFSLIT